MSEDTQINISTTTEIVNVDVTETLQPVSLECYFAQSSASDTVVNISESIQNIDLDITEIEAQNVEIDFSYPAGPPGPPGPGGGSSLWGTISGTLSAQTDLWKYLSAVGTSNFDILTLTNYLSTNSILLCSLNVNGQILSGGINLLDIFLTAETDAQTLSYAEFNYLLSISNGNTVNLSSINSTFAANSGKYENVYTNVQLNSASWNTAYNYSTVFSNVSSRYDSTSTVVETNSANWPTQVKILNDSETNLDASLYGVFVKTVSSNQVFTYSNFVSGQTIAVYLSANHSDYLRHYFPDNTLIQKAGEYSAAVTFSNTITRVTIQNIGEQCIGIANVVFTEVKNTQNYISLDGIFGFLLLEDDYYLLQE